MAARTAHIVKPAPPPAGANTRLKKKDATRQILINATVDAIAVGGFADLTLSEVSRRAAVSRGLVNFHFASKNQLLVETLAFLTNEYLQSWQRAVDKAGAGPAARLLALVRNDFHPKVCNRKKVAVWFAFRGEAKSRPTYIDVCTKADDAFDRALERLCADILAEGGHGADPRRVATGLRAMIEGLWLEFLMSPHGLTREAALAVAGAYLVAVFPSHFEHSDFERHPSNGDEGDA
ncbi:MAG TPA: TetR family transcriptional regulator C-terminal domain-containing protein [Aestuariivirgaceae bacterium]|nr:TetR family transcriptional regulator C-terminal domain-containing protein [Aestuariivirgaceae bacterium]